MNINLKNKLELCRKKLMANNLKQGVNFNGYEVYEPVYNEETVGGFPQIVLVKDGEARISTYEECFEYMKFIKNGRKSNV